MYRYDRFCQSLSLCTVLVSMHACVVCLLSVRARLVRCVRAVFLVFFCVCYIYISIIIYRGGVFDARAGVTDPQSPWRPDTHHINKARSTREISSRDARVEHYGMYTVGEIMLYNNFYSPRTPHPRPGAAPPRPRRGARARSETWREGNIQIRTPCDPPSPPAPAPPALSAAAAGCRFFALTLYFAANASAYFCFCASA